MWLRDDDDYTARLCVGGCAMMGPWTHKGPNDIHIPTAHPLVFGIRHAHRDGTDPTPSPPLPFLPPRRTSKYRFLPDAEYGIALDNLVKGCTDVLLGHPDGLRIFVGRRCVQRECVVVFFVDFRSRRVFRPFSRHIIHAVLIVPPQIDRAVYRYYKRKPNRIGGSSVDGCSPARRPSIAACVC